MTQQSSGGKFGPGYWLKIGWALSGAFVVGVLTLWGGKAIEWIVARAYRFLGMTVHDTDGARLSDGEANIFLWVALLAFSFLFLVPIYKSYRRRARARRFKKRLESVFAPDRYVSEVYTTQDGFGAWLAIKVPQGLWNARHEFYLDDSYWDHSSILEKNVEYRFLIVGNPDNPVVIPARGRHPASVKIDIICRYRGIKGTTHEAAHWMHFFASNVGIPLLTPLITSACFVLMKHSQALMRAVINQSWCDDAARYLLKQSDQAPTLPSYAKIEAIEIETVTNEGQQFVFRKPLAARTLSEIVPDFWTAIDTFPTSSLTGFRWWLPKVPSE